MQFFQHKINPGSDKLNEQDCLNIMAKMGFVGTGYSDFAGEFSADKININDTVENKDKYIRECMDVAYKDKDWNYNQITVNNIRHFAFDMRSGDILMIPLTKQFSNEVHFAQVVNDDIINTKKDIPFFGEADIGFLRKVKILKSFEYGSLPDIIKNAIEDEKRKSTTVKIEKQEVIMAILDII